LGTYSDIILIAQKRSMMKPIIVFSALVVLIFVNLRNQPQRSISSSDLLPAARSVTIAKCEAGSGFEPKDSGFTLSGSVPNTSLRNESSRSALSNLSGKYYSIGFIYL